MFAFASISYGDTSPINESTAAKAEHAVIVEPAVEIDLKKDGDSFNKQLYENSIKSNEQLLITMQWAIGIVSTVIIVLFGSQLFYNYRISKEEVNAIRSELEENLATLKSDMLENLNKTSNKQEKSMQQAFNQTELELKGNIKTSFEEKEKLFNAITETLRKENELLKDKVESELKNINHNITQLEGYVWDLKGIAANALRRFIEIANTEIKEGFTRIYGLKDIIDTLEKLNEIHIRDYRALRELLPKIPAIDNTNKNKIETLYKDLSQYTFDDDPDNPGRLKYRSL